MNLNPKSTACIFPGQGSQSVGMGKDLAAQYPAAREIFEKADDLLGFKLSELAWDGPEEELNDTANTQPALLVHSIAAAHVFHGMVGDFHPAFMAGHSLGELSALTVAGALSFEEGLKLVRTRGELMKQAGNVSPGGMAAILGLDIPDVERLCTEASSIDENVQVANDNCPGQVVISGHSGAVERAIEAAKEAGAKRAMPLAVSIAAHSTLMEHAQADFNQAVNAAPMQQPGVPVIGNVLAMPLGSVEDIRADLQAQLTSRVRWTESVEYMAAHGVDTFIELGTGDVLIGLIRRINRDARRYKFGTPEDIESLGA